MARHTIVFHCGCGFRTVKPLEAAVHADSTGHTLDAQGLVKPENKKEK